MLSAGGKKWLKVQGLGWELDLTLPIGVHCTKSKQGWQVFVRKPDESYATATLEYVVACVRQPTGANPENKEQWLALVGKRIACSSDGLDGASFTYHNGYKNVTDVLRKMLSVSVIDVKAKIPCVCVKNVSGCPEKSELLIEFSVNFIRYPTSSRFALRKVETEDLIGKTKDGWVYVTMRMKQMAATWDQLQNAKARRSFWKAVRGYVEAGAGKVTIQGIRALADKHLTLSVESAAGAAGVGVGASACKGSKVGGQGIVAKGVTPVVTIMTGASAGAGCESLGKTADADEDASGVGMAGAGHRVEDAASTGVFTEGGVGAASNTNSAAGAGGEPFATGMAGNTEGDAGGRVTKKSRVDERPSKGGVPVSAQAQSESDFADDLSLEDMDSYGVELDNCADAEGGLERLLLDFDEETLYTTLDVDNLFEGLDGVTPTPTSTPLLTAAASLDPYPGKGLGAPQVEGRVEP